MLKSRVITITFRFYLAFATAAIIGAIGAAIGSSDDPTIDRVIGPLSVGWKGGVGDHLAYSVLLGVAVVTAFLGILFTAFRDADPSAEAQSAELDAVPLTRAPIGANYWPVVSAFSVATLLIGLAISSQGLALAGAAVLAAAAFMWTARAWAERATGDDRANVELYQQMVEPLRLPIFAALLVGVMVLGFSRVLLALPNTKSSAAVFGVVALLVLVGVTAIAFRPRLSKSALTLIVFAFGLIVVASGIAAAWHGARDIEHHHPAGEEQPAGEGG